MLFSIRPSGTLQKSQTTGETIDQVGAAKESKLFFTRDVAPRRASNHGLFYRNYGENKVTHHGRRMISRKPWINMKSKREFLQSKTNINFFFSSDKQIFSFSH